MEQARGRALRRSGVLVIVLGGHVLLALLLSSSRPTDTRKGAMEPRTVLIVLTPEPPHSEEPPVERTRETPPTTSGRPRRAVRVRKTPISTPSEDRRETSGSIAITTPDASGTTPKKDWQLEMESTLRAMMPDIQQEWQRRCDEAERAHAPRIPGCNRRSYDGPWRPSGPFLFSLKDLRDPDRPRSSVPDLPGNPFPMAPRPQVFKDRPAR